MIRSIAALALALLGGCAAVPPPAPRETPPQGPRTAIRGHIVTTEGVVRNGWIVASGGRIESISPARPQGALAQTLETDDYVFPTFVDLHNHPMYNMFPRWKAPRQFANRYEWRADPGYLAKIANPQRQLADISFCPMDQFAEVQMLIAGTGATTGIGPPRDGIPQCIVGLVRNLDWASGFHGDKPGNERVRTLIGVTRDIRNPADEERVRGIVADLKADRIDAVVIHVAEGRRDDAETQAEFAALEKWGLLAPQAVLVHAIALGEKELEQVGKARASLVWSPRSNIELYGDTMDVRAALRRGIPVALAPDWAPTGSINMLEELRYANEYSRTALDGAITPKQLFEMATRVPAKIAKVDGEIGSLAAGKRADLFVLRNRDADPYQALVAAAVTDISLVMIDGVPIYGDGARLKALNVAATDPLAVCGVARELNSASMVSGRFADAALTLAQYMMQLGAGLGRLTDCPP